MEHADIQQTQSNRREFDVKEGIVDIFGGLGGEETNAARDGHRKACGCDGHGRGGNGGQGSTSPKAQQTEVDHQNGAEERGDAQNVDEINDAISPYAGLAHGVAKHGTLQPRHEFVQTELPARLYLRSG